MNKTIIKCVRCGENYEDKYFDILTEKGVKGITKRIYCNNCIDELTAQESKMIKFNCKKCGYIWIPRVENPKLCPLCKGRLTKRGRGDITL